MTSFSQAGVQAGTATQLHNVRDFWDRILNHGPTAVHRKYPCLQHTRRARWPCVGMVSCEHVHLHRRACDGRLSLRPTNQWGTLLVDALLCQPQDAQRALLPGRILEHAWFSRRSLLNRLWIQPHVPIRHCDRQGWDLDAKLWRGVRCLSGLRLVPRCHRKLFLESDGQAADGLRRGELCPDCGHHYRATDRSAPPAQRWPLYIR
jgi:hypothetical protein